MAREIWVVERNGKPEQFHYADKNEADWHVKTTCDFFKHKPEEYGVVRYIPAEEEKK